MEERKEQKLHISNELISGLLFLAMLCVRFVPELLIVSTFRVQQHSLAPSLPVLYQLLGCAAGIVLFAVVTCFLVSKIGKRADEKQKFCLASQMNLVPLVFGTYLLDWLFRNLYTQEFSLLGKHMAAGYGILVAITFLLTVLQGFAFYGYVGRSMQAPLEKPVRNMLRQFGKGIVLILILGVFNTIPFFVDTLIGFELIPSGIAIHFLGKVLAAFGQACCLLFALKQVIRMLEKEAASRVAESVEPEAQTEVMQKNQGIAVILKFPVISTVIIAVLLFGAVGIRKLTMNPVKQMEEYAGLYMVSTSGKLLAGDVEGALLEARSARNLMDMWIVAAGGTAERSVDEIYRENSGDTNVLYLTAMVKEDPALIERYIRTHGMQPQMCLALLDIYEEMEELTPTQRRYRADAMNACISKGVFTATWARPDDLEDSCEKLEAAAENLKLVYDTEALLEQISAVGKAGSDKSAVLKDVLALAEEYPDNWMAQYLAAYVGSEATSDDARHYDQTIAAAKKYVKLYVKEVEPNEAQEYALYISASQMIMKCYGYEEALPYLEKVMDNGSKEQQNGAFVLALKCYEALKDYETCLEQCDVFLNEYPENADALYYGAIAALKLGDADSALEYADSLATLTEETVTAESFGNDVKLYTILQYIVLRDDSHYTQYQYEIYSKLSDEQKQQIAENSFFADYLGAVYNCFVNKDKEHYALALADVERVLETNEELPQAWYLKGAILFSMGETANYEKAVDAYKRALAINPENPTTWYALANAYDGLGEYQQAYEACQHTMSLLPEVDHGYDWYGVSYHCEALMRALERELN